MIRSLIAVFAAAVLTAPLAHAQTPGGEAAPAPKPPLFETKKVDGTDNVYVFRYQSSQRSEEHTSELQSH